MDTKIWCVFPACGKTWACKHQEDYGLKLLDSDSSNFSWLCVVDEKYEIKNRGKKNYKEQYVKVRNPDFPKNYIEHIKENIGKYDYIFVSTHAAVREALDKEGIEFTIVYPRGKCIAEWVGRCFVREKVGETGCSAEAMYDNWSQWIWECIETGTTHEEIVLNSGGHLSDLFFDHHL